VVFGVIEITIELAKLTTVCHLRWVPARDFAVRPTFALMSQKNGRYCTPEVAVHAALSGVGVGYFAEAVQ
jgi:hypothetical protein